MARNSIHGCKHVAEAAHGGGDFCNPKSVWKVQWLVEKKTSLSSACLVSGFCMVFEFAFDLEVIVLDKDTNVYQWLRDCKEVARFHANSNENMYFCKGKLV